MNRVIFIVITIGLIVGGAMLWQNQADNQQAEIDNAQNFTYVTALGEMSLIYPADWTPTENSIDSIEEGLYALELESPGADVAKRAIEEASGVEIDNIAETITDQAVVDAITLPQAEKYALLEINTASANSFELFETLDEWFAEFSSDIETASGISLSQPQPFEIKEGDAIEFYSTIVQGDKTINTWHVFALGVAAQVEAVLYPGSGFDEPAAREIIRSMTITDILIGS